MNTTLTTCPTCGHESAGRFCSDCGAPLTGMTCPACSAQLGPGARFCHRCGTPLGKAQPSSGSGARAGWIAAAAVSVALVVVLASRFGAGPQQGPTPPAAAPVPAARPATDISTMTPRQRADRLFDRIMIASEGGFADSVRFFSPMALQAYAMLGTPDIDARYHLGLIHALSGDADAVRAQLDSLRAESPDHLFGSMLAYTLAELTGDADGVTRAYEAFLASYDAEFNSGKQEYALHQRALEAFRQEASAAGGR